MIAYIHHDGIFLPGSLWCVSARQVRAALLHNDVSRVQCLAQPGSTAHSSDTELWSQLWHFIFLLNFRLDLVAELLTFICSETANLNL